MKAISTHTTVISKLPGENLFFSGLSYLLPLFLLLFVYSSKCPGQQVPLNLGFETGTFTGWTGATGQCCPVYTPQSGIDTGRHVITSGNFADPYSNGLVDVVAPGSLFSARLGNNSGSAESEILDYTFQVPSDSLLLVLRFAVILENGNHPPVKQSRFGYEITSNTASLSGCLMEQVVAGDSSNNFIINGPYEMLNWQTRVINLTGMQGADISIHFETGDCEPGGHFGYAYVDGDLKEAKIAGNFCNPDGSITLYAPTGLSGTWFDASTADSVIVAVPLAGSTYTFELADENGCTVTLSKNLAYELPQSIFSYTTDCDFTTAFQNNSICDPGSAYHWEYGDGQTGNNLNPIHNYNGFGTYEVSLTVNQPDNCLSRHTELISLNEVPEANFTTKGSCIGQPIIFINTYTAATGTGLAYSWFIDGQLTYTTASPEHTFSQPGTHSILLVVTDTSNCTDSATAEIMISDFIDCFEITSGPWLPNAFTPNNDGINDFFGAVAEPESESITITIYDRFGAALFSGDRWDGSQNGRFCPSGIYSYRINYPMQSQHQKQTGTIVLIR